MYWAKESEEEFILRQQTYLCMGVICFEYLFNCYFKMITECSTSYEKQQTLLDMMVQWFRFSFQNLQSSILRDEFSI